MISKENTPKRIDNWQHEKEDKSLGNDVTLIKNSKWMPHNSHETVLCSNWLILPLSKFQHGKDKGNAP